MQLPVVTHDPTVFALRAQHGDMIALDTETTGLEVDARITDIGAVLVHAGTPVLAFESLVHPDIPIPEKIETLTGITNADVKDAPAPAKLLPALLKALAHTTLLGQNIPFDIGRLVFEAGRLGLAFPPVSLADTDTLARKKFPAWKHYHLTNICQYYGISTDHHHHALDDAWMTYQCWEKMNS